MNPSGAARYFDVAPTDRAMAALRDVSPFVPELELELDAVLDHERLARALALLAARHRILGATLDRAEPRVAWRPDTTAPRLVRTIEECALDPERGPTCRLVHTHAGDHSRLALGVHHAVADGRAVVVLLDDLRRLYVSLECGEQSVVDTDWSDRTIGALLDRRGVGIPTRLRMGWDAARRWTALSPSTHRDAALAPAPDDSAPDGCAGTASATPIGFDRGCLAAIERVGASRGWRRNHVLLAVVTRAWLDVVGHEPRSPSVSGWLVAVDCRRQLAAARGVGNLSGLEPLSLVDIESISLRDTVDAARDAFAPLRRPGAGMIADLTSPAAWFAPQPLRDRVTLSTFEARNAVYRYTRFYSHLDRLPDSLAEWGRAQALGVRWSAASSAPPYVAMMLVTFRGTTALTVIAPPATLAAARARAFGERAADSLAALAAETGAPVG